VPLLAERIYQHADGSQVVVRIFAPEIRGEDASCAIEIEHGARRRRIEAGGADAMQALLMGLSAIRANLTIIPVRWLGQEGPCLDLVIG
jgi:hypothetical protein